MATTGAPAMITDLKFQPRSLSDRMAAAGQAVFRRLPSLAVILGAITAFFVNGLPAAATEGAAAARLDDVRAGSLLIRNGADGYADATRLGIDVNLTVSGSTIRARVTQIFRNPTKDWVEAVYVYPLPEGGAVDTLKLVVGDRIVVGEIQERKTAREIYEQAKAAGQKTALMEQERPNIFTNSVANIGPGETVVVQLEYQEAVRQSGDQFSLRAPLVVAPRYSPAPIVQTVEFGSESRGWGQTTDQV